MRNTILTAMFLMLVPGMASAQFYTITKETEVKPIQINRKEKAIDNKKDTVISKSIERTNTLPFLYQRIAHPWFSMPKKWTAGRPKNSNELNQTVIFLIWRYLTSTLKSNGTVSYIRKWYWHKPFWKQDGLPLRCAGIDITSLGWLIHTLESIMSLSIGRKVSAPTIPRCSTSTNEKMGTICFGWKRLGMRKLLIIFRQLSVCWKCYNVPY